MVSEHNVSLLTTLKDGNERFCCDQLNHQRQDGDRRKGLVAGQSPSAVILSCADSRVVPELMFDMGLGELFVVRVAGNVANTCSIASIEYAVAHLGVKLIVVLGHENCGAVAAALAGGNNGHNLNHLLAHLTPAVTDTPGDSAEATLRAAVQTNAQHQAQDLHDRSAILSGAEGLDIVPAYYNLDSGKVDFLE